MQGEAVVVLVHVRLVIGFLTSSKKSWFSHAYLPSFLFYYLKFLNDAMEWPEALQPCSWIRFTRLLHCLCFHSDYEENSFSAMSATCLPN